MTVHGRPGDFVQLGATRDGLDPYLDAARDVGLRAVLVETPAYLRLRRVLGRRPFDLEVAAERPHEPATTAAALAAAGVRPALLLTGFERYADAGFALARTLRTAPWPRSGERFRPPDKHRQRAALKQHAPGVRQPGFAQLGPQAAGADSLAYPQVVKPVDGGGGLGVLLVDDPAGRTRAVRLLSGMRNYGGGAFIALLAEEFVKGPEVSLQGVAFGGRPYLLSVCEKLTTVEDVAGEPGLRGFRELGHLARPGREAGDALHTLAADCLDATGYQEGPFHIDVIQAPAGPVFVEMGFRLSGNGLTALVHRATGRDWARTVLDTHLEGRAPELPRTERRAAVGQVTVFGTAELAAADALAREDPGVEVLRASTPGAVPPGDRDLLAPDLLRHADAAGRVVVTAADPETVRTRLTALSAARLRG